MSPLYELKEGEQGEIVEISNRRNCKKNQARRNGCNRYGRISDLGIRVGKTIEVLQNRNQGVLLVKVDESRIAIGRGMAEKIQIRRPEKNL